ncbi:TPA: glycoside hydrolase family protein [Klebsiella pneumoniae]|uniref:glycoside hydrolase family protein n=1 Tax=Enterobacteriaceae TaxID=543 RepID=UPI000E528DD3|nr:MULTISPECIES: glycoside hydrolase family protein [Enterobacteriaceae]EFK6279635.1 glycoside hydrolase family protein [Escherichia coli]EGE6540598.1 glycoside hydrolase family protein [Escherichia coli]ELG9686725.1 glycoside hydrolase family protein [Escherichia coli]MBR8629228.1 glycoside hydrolase family protein [Klebsiella pneumoniae subsp. pneumoniae]MBY5082219.1 glycoside hydrolase family protein [Klebsiella pneumoniae]
MDLKSRLKEYEGTITYQKKLGYFRNGKFFPYSDSLGFSTIGYGHLIKSGENFSTGLSPIDAETLLDKDIAVARTGLSTLRLGTLPADIEDYLIIMIFQLGVNGVSKFRKLLAAAKAGDRDGMRRESVDSLWYRQTPNRVRDMNNQLT